MRMSLRGMIFLLLVLCAVAFAAPAKNDAVPMKKATAKKSLVHWMDYSQAMEKAKSGHMSHISVDSDIGLLFVQ